MDPYGHLRPQQGEDSVTALYPRLDRVPAAASQSASVALDGRLGFVGALPEQIQRTEARRGQLIALMNDMEDERTAYDAAVWTVAPWLVYRLVTPGYSDLNVQHQLVGGAAGLAAWKASLGGRTTDVQASMGSPSFGWVVRSRVRAAISSHALNWLARSGGGCRRTHESLARAERGDESVTINTLAAIQRALEEAGIEFPEGTVAVSVRYRGHGGLSGCGVVADPSMPSGTRFQ